MAMFLLLLALLLPASPRESALKTTVSAYWTLMAKGEKAAALKFVLPGCQNDFVNRVEPKIRSWALVSTESVTDKEAVVTIRIEALFKEAALRAGFQTFEKRETWVWDKNSWKLKVPKPSLESIAPLFAKTKAQNDLPKVIRLTPVLIRIQFLNKAQVGRLLVQNGTSLPAELVSAKFDEARFELVERPSVIEAGKTAPLVLRYKGEENEKNLESRLTVVLRHGNQEKLYQVPILYNYFSEGARGLFGLTEEQANELKKGDKLSPAIKQPQTGPSQAPKPQTPPGKQP